MAGFAGVMPLAYAGAAADDGQEEGVGSVRELFAKSPGINALAAARVALFGARDGSWSGCRCSVLGGWTFTMVGTFLAG